MSNNSLPESLHRHAIAGRVEIITGRNGLPCAKIMTPWSTAEIYLLGAHVTAFQKNGEPPLLFLSAKSRFAPGQAIRGGVPICYPWFGPRPDEPIHGYARLADWQLLQTRATPAGAVTLWLALPPVAGRETWQSLRTEFIITVAETLTMELITTNDACGETVTLENCLHTYLQIGDINAISLTGLETVPFNDFAHGANGAPRPAENAPLRITQETNRVYPRHAAAVAIRDEKFKRVIRVEKSGSQSTVVWNPWTTQKMPDDWGTNEHLNMVCVESGNVKQDKISLAPGQTTALKVVVGSEKF